MTGCRQTGTSLEDTGTSLEDTGTSLDDTVMLLLLIFDWHYEAWQYSHTGIQSNSHIVILLLYIMLLDTSFGDTVKLLLMLFDWAIQSSSHIIVDAIRHTVIQSYSHTVTYSDIIVVYMLLIDVVMSSEL